MKNIIINHHHHHQQQPSPPQFEMAIGRILESLNPTWPLFQTHCALTIPLCHPLLISPPHQLDFSFLSIGFLLIINFISPPYQLDVSSSSIGFLLLILESLNPTWPLFQTHCALTIPLCHLQHCHWLWMSPSSEELDNKNKNIFRHSLFVTSMDSKVCFQRFDRQGVDFVPTMQPIISLSKYHFIILQPIIFPHK